jgi:hypothetical protein
MCMGVDDHSLSLFEVKWHGRDLLRSPIEGQRA